MTNIPLRKRAVLLRKEGYSYNHISKTISVSKSTLSGWLSDVRYAPNAFTIASIGNARAKSGEAKAQQKKKSYEMAHKNAKADIGKLTKRDLFMLGIGLYIGEGSKTHDIVRIVNSDPAIIHFSVRWLQSVGVPIQHMSARIHLYPSMNVHTARVYWSRVSGIPISQFQSESIDRRSGKKIARSNTCPHGTLHVSVRALGNKELGVDLSRRIGAWMSLVLEYEAQNAGLV